ncbi:MAG: nucleotidyltransferase domain-containing protein [Nanoarchaeota archaeon]
MVNKKKNKSRSNHSVSYKSALSKDGFNKGSNITDERGIALDFSTRLYKKFSKLIKSVILFGSSVKNNSTSDSDVDIMIIVDDASIIWDQELIAWYREELANLVAEKSYTKNLHVNTTKLTTWWNDMMRGDPVVINIIRYGEAILDFGGFFNPLKILLDQGKIKSTPEAVFTALERAPAHLSRSKNAQLSTVEGIYWCMVDSSQAALMASRIVPPSPEQIPIMLKEQFVDKGMLKMKYAIWFKNFHEIHRSIAHAHQKEIKGSEIDEWQARAQEFMDVMIALVKGIIEKNNTEDKQK